VSHSPTPGGSLS